ncbi:hypothetical protein WMY93_002645 [Mugilogobius chulae]|uniref:LRRNT domain-containing protein n=1 Tax=Mugilogobius chulae TaxID=88201 RepID=A0AAW0PX99_9GOBI
MPPSLVSHTEEALCGAAGEALSSQGKHWLCNEAMAAVLHYKKKEKDIYNQNKFPAQRLFYGVSISPFSWCGRRMPSLYLVLFLLTVSYPLPSSLNSHLCPVRCVCYEHANLVDCQDQGFEQVPRGLPHGTWLLKLGGNNLTEIRTHAFVGLWSLRVLDLGISQIQDIRPKAFFSLSFLEKLDLSWNLLTTVPADFSSSMSTLKELRLEHNYLRFIPANSFENLDSLEKLYLSYNQLETVGPGVLKGLSRLRQLYLQYNRLTVVQQGSMDMLPGLEVLQLSSNNISHIDSGALAPLYSLAVLALDGNNLHNLKFKRSSACTQLRPIFSSQVCDANPWSCDCELHRVFSKILFVRYLHIDDYRNVTCHEPPLLAGYSLAWVDSRLCVAETATVLVITITVLVTVVAAVVMAERNRKRKERRTCYGESPTQTQSPPS